MFISLEWFNAGLAFSLISYGILLYYTMKSAGVNSVLFLFMILFGLYGYSVPISVFFEADIGWHRVAKLSTWQSVDFTLFSFMLSNQLALLAIALLYLFFIKRRTMNISNSDYKEPKFSYFYFAIIAGLFASISEALNFLRVGGFSAISNGKAYYQGAVNDLVLNIPYEGFLYISIGLFAMFFASLGRSMDKYLIYLPIYLTSIFFVLFTNLLIGERGLLVVAMVIFFLGLTIKTRITKVKFIYFVLIGFLYVAFSFLTLLREDRIKYEGFTKFITTYETTLLRIMNPANTEFGAPALNYRIFMDLKDPDYNYKFGATYLEITTAFIPVYIYPNKPIGIVYEFRNTYFPERRKQGSTAGTGFSSLMEAYMNFGYFGPFVAYLFFLFVLIYLESKRANDNIFVNLFYLLSFNVFLIFSRSSSQYILQTAIFYLVQIAVVVIVYKILPKKVLATLKFDK